MSPSAIASADIDRFGAVIARNIGFRFDEARREYLADVLRRRLEAHGGTRPGAYLRRLESGWPSEEEVVVERITVGETYFFRYADHFRVFVEAAIEPLLARGGGRLSVLSAGCSTGEEPYSLAMTIRERVPEATQCAVSIDALDVNPVSLARAKAGRYSRWALRETPDAMRTRYFQREGDAFVVDPSIRRMVRFERANFAGDDALPRLAPEAFDVVFCRNMTMYFSPEVTQRLMARIARALVPGGLLFLGHAETLRGVSREFTLCSSGDAFYYRLGQVEVEQATNSAARSVEVNGDDATWVETIRGASGRIAALEYDARPAHSITLANASQGEGDVEAAKSSPESQLLRAVLLADGGKIDEAEETCRKLLADDDLNAGAHYVLALCREHAGDGDGALEEDRVAAYLDPEFAMPHLHRGLLARRRARIGEARAALERAIGLLVSESDARILLFGGGFSRDALVLLCRAEIAACGARS